MPLNLPAGGETGGGAGGRDTAATAASAVTRSRNERRSIAIPPAAYRMRQTWTMDALRNWLDLDRPIVQSRLEPDFYKFAMGQLIWRKYRDVSTTFSFRNRTAKARLGEVIDPGELREQFDHARSLRFTNSELHYLRGTNEYQQRMFDEPYLEYLRALQLPEYQVERRAGDLRIAFAGPWADVTYWETIALSIINETYYRTLLRGLSRFEREAIFAEGIRRLRGKIAALRQHPEIVFSDFGTRRRFSGSWQHYIDESLMQELNQ